MSNFPYKMNDRTHFAPLRSDHFNIPHQGGRVYHKTKRHLYLPTGSLMTSRFSPNREAPQRTDHEYSSSSLPIRPQNNRVCVILQNLMTSLSPEQQEDYQ